RLAAEPQTGRREVSALTDARKTLAYDFFRILRAPQYKKKNNLYLFHIPSLYLKTPAFIPEHRKSVFQIILDNFLLPVTVPIIK
ncbi:hypothetical protein L6M77_29565, partial [Klebsiella pneumoniae]|nr:hypothetical protein [Klebsiella pneumoniae]